MKARQASAAFFALIVTTSMAFADPRVTVPAGTLLRVRLDTAVASDTSRIEDPVRARLASPIVINGRTIVPAGSTLNGVITQATRAGKVKGRGQLGLRFHTLAPAGDDERYRISTRTWSRIAPATKKKDATTIAVPAAGGAVIGGLIGGKKGAAIGAAAGGGGGTAVVLSTRGKGVRLGRGAVLMVRLAQPLTLH
jgi:hypothetical protein